MKTTSFFILIVVFTNACSFREQSKLYEKAERKILQEEYHEANSLLKQVVELNTKSKIAVKAYYWMGYISEVYFKDYSSALFNYTEFLTRSQDEVANYEVMKKLAALQFEQLNNTEKAINAYKKLLDNFPNTLEEDFFLIRLAEGYYKLNNFDTMRFYCQTLINKYPKSSYTPKAYYYITSAYFLEAKYELAIEAAKNLIQTNKNTPYSIEAEFLVGQCFEQLKKFQDAYNIYKELENKYNVPKIIKLRLEEVKRKISSTSSY